MLHVPRLKSFTLFNLKPGWFASASGPQPVSCRSIWAVLGSADVQPSPPEPWPCAESGTGPV